MNPKDTAIAKDKVKVANATVDWSSVAGPKDVTGFLADQNPYEAMLALADKIVVTADSIAMTNEALATGQCRIQHWATFLTSVPKKHHYIQQQQSARRLYATKTVHEKAVRKTKFSPRLTYQPTTPATWIISDGSVSADKEAIALAKGLQLPWTIKRVEWLQ
ncbi:hypothetical protein BGZ49_005142, partial [Haplosporangium sp. Z 27]